MATIGIGYVIRPLAAGFIGHFGDRIGRSQMLVLTLVVMGVATFLIGCLPPAPPSAPPPRSCWWCCARCRAPPRPANPSAPSP